jgi:DamX protein
MTLSADCFALLQLNQEPFAQVSDEQFLYTDSLLDSLHDMARNAITHPDTIVFLMSESGAGRSTQLMRLLSDLPNNFELIAFRGRNNTTFAAVEVTIRNHLQSYGYDNPNSPLEELLTTRNRLGFNQIIAIDDAHTLGTDIVQRLLALRSKIIAQAGCGPRLILSGATTLGSGALQYLDAQDVKNTTRLTLQPFNLEQTRHYLAHRLKIAGNPEPSTLLDDDAVADLHQRSGGRPALLNPLADGWLSKRCRQLKTAPITPTPKPEPVTQENKQESQETKKIEPPPEEVVTQEEPEAQPATPKIAWWRRRWFIPAIAGCLFIGLLSLFVRHASNLSITLPTFEWGALFDQSEQNPTPTQALATAEPVANTMPQVAIQTPPTTPSDTAPEEQPPDTTEPEVTTHAMAAGASEVTPEPPVIMDSDSPEAINSPPTRPLVDKKWLLSQNPAHYTIQLIALKQLSGIERYIERHKLQTVRIIPTRSLIIGIVGNFADRDTAQQFVAELPESVREQGYWVRNIGDVQQDAQEED